MPKITLTLDSTQISTTLKCFHMWALGYRESLSKGDQKTQAMDEGTLIHALLDTYYTLKSVSNSADSFKIAKATLLTFTENRLFSYYPDIDEKRWEFLAQRFLQYIFKNNNSDFVPLKIKGIPAVELGFSKILYEDAKYLFIVEGRIDLITEISNQTCWVDHKTQGAAKRLYKFKPQFLTYAWATGYSKAIINYIRLHQTYNEKDTLVKEVIDFPPFIIKEWEDTMLRKVFFPLAHILEHNGMDCTSNNFEKNRGSCSGAYDSAPCMFTQLCETQSPEMQESIKNFAYVKIKPWRPWE